MADAHEIASPQRRQEQGRWVGSYLSPAKGAELLPLGTQREKQDEAMPPPAGEQIQLPCPGWRWVMARTVSACSTAGAAWAALENQSNARPGPALPLGVAAAKVGVFWMVGW